MLDATIFEGMEADNRQSSAGREAVWQASQRDIEPFEFLVDGYTECLESARRWVNGLVALPGIAAADDGCQLVCRFDGAGLPGLDDGPGDASAQSVFTVLVDQVCEVWRTQALKEPRCGFSFGGVESEVQAPMRMETEASIRIFQLITGESQVKEDGINSLDPELRQDLREVGVIALQQGRLARCQDVARAFQGEAIPIESHEVTVGLDFREQ